jgi:hypothetical protein
VGGVIRPIVAGHDRRTSLDVSILSIPSVRPINEDLQGFFDSHHKSSTIVDNHHGLTDGTSDRGYVTHLLLSLVDNHVYENDSSWDDTHTVHSFIPHPIRNRTARPGDMSNNTSSDSRKDERYTPLNERIQWEIREKEMMELALKAERAAEAGQERFVGSTIHSGFGFSFDPIQIQGYSSSNYPLNPKRDLIPAPKRTESVNNICVKKDLPSYNDSFENLISMNPMHSWNDDPISFMKSHLSQNIDEDSDMERMVKMSGCFDAHLDALVPGKPSGGLVMSDLDIDLLINHDLCQQSNMLKNTNPRHRGESIDECFELFASMDHSSGLAMSVTTNMDSDKKILSFQNFSEGSNSMNRNNPRNIDEHPDALIDLLAPVEPTGGLVKSNVNTDRLVNHDYREPPNLMTRNHSRTLDVNLDSEPAWVQLDVARKHAPSNKQINSALPSIAPNAIGVRNVQIESPSFQLSKLMFETVALVQSISELCRPDIPTAVFNYGVSDWSQPGFKW